MVMIQVVVVQVTTVVVVQVNTNNLVQELKQVVVVHLIMVIHKSLQVLLRQVNKMKVVE